MKRLTLDIDDLRVDSFDTATEAPIRGTVRALEQSEETGNGYCESAFSGPCCTPWGSYGGGTCESTCEQRACGCTYPDRTGCDYTCNTCDFHLETCYQGCQTYQSCPTSPGYPGCS